jgi:hypothetical protein
VPLPLARRIDRASRVAHRFHRFAHHPLCHAYAPELIAWGGKTRVCRGCAFSALGVAGGLGGGLATAPYVPASLELAVGLAVLAFVVLAALSFSSLRRARPARGPAASSSGGGGSQRPSKLVSRLIPAGMLGFVLARSGMAGSVPGALIVVAVCAAALLLIALYRQRGPDRSRCQVCPEYGRGIPCSGVTPILRRERAFRRLAGAWLAREFGK